MEQPFLQFITTYDILDCGKEGVNFSCGKDGVINVAVLKDSCAGELNPTDFKLHEVVIRFMCEKGILISKLQVINEGYSMFTNQSFRDISSDDMKKFIDSLNIEKGVKTPCFQGYVTEEFHKSFVVEMGSLRPEYKVLLEGVKVKSRNTSKIILILALGILALTAIYFGRRDLKEAQTT